MDGLRFNNRTISCGRTAFFHHRTTDKNGWPHHWLFTISQLSYQVHMVVVDLNSMDLFGQFSDVFTLYVKNKDDSPKYFVTPEEELVERGIEVLDHIDEYEDKTHVDAFSVSDYLVILDHDAEYLTNHALAFKFNHLDIKDKYICHCFYYSTEHDDWYEMAYDAVIALEDTILDEEKEIYTNDEDYGPRTKL